VEYHLTNAERATLALALRGLTNDEIASLQRLSSHTVRNRLSVTYAKLGVSSRAEATYVVLDRGAHQPQQECRRNDPVQRHIQAVRECFRRRSVSGATRSFGCR
jgi:DNA-binding CsgD family transcriptional regulator